MNRGKWHCGVRLDGDVVEVGNSLIRRRYRLENGRLLPQELWNLQTGYCWTAPPSVPLADFGLAPDDQGAVLRETELPDGEGLHAVLTRTAGALRLETHWQLFEGLPFYSVWHEIQGGEHWYLPEEAVSVAAADGVETKKKGESRLFADALEAVGLPGRHLRLESVLLQDKSDVHDALVGESEQLLYANEVLEQRGSIFRLTEYMDGEGLLLCKDSPSPSSQIGHRPADLVVDRKRVAGLVGTGAAGVLPDGCRGYGVTVGVGEPETLQLLFKRYYRAKSRCAHRPRCMMSNTWGDRNQDKAVSHAFLIKEVETAAALGIDVVQIDDGWQKGITSNSAVQTGGVFSGYYDRDPGFWDVNSGKFPHGLEPIIQKARQAGVEIGLWFSPDSSGEFANWQRDVETVAGLWSRFGIRYFKLDGVELPTKTAETRYARFLRETAARTDEQVVFCQDITAGNRPGHLYMEQYGLVFVENRYTDWGNYTPHNTLRNLWSLARWLPVDRYQFELLNHRRNPDKYPGDPLAPSTYSAGYLFASVMAANPLFWMELSALAPRDVAELSELVRFYRTIRDTLPKAEMHPIGECPDGTRYTGFHIAGEKGGYLILLREQAEAASYTYRDRSLRKIAGSYSVLAAGATAPVSVEEVGLSGERCLRVSGLPPKGYAIVLYGDPGLS
ncbi:alpha-galactosidase [Ruminococcaceae bacterium OttesenSCG-928-L11]|nr:alpha-galactosidase [Ruminococcaceae bacterium OttesenSCG-928-L11]